MFRSISALLLCIVLGACSAPLPPPATIVAPTGIQDYKLGVADKVRIIVYNDQSISRDYAVGPSGTLSIPLIGEVQARGRTVEQVRTDVQTKLGDGYLVNPNVSMEVVAFRPFYILGEVNKPGEYPYAVGLTIGQAVATAQGYTYRADQRRIFIKPADEADEREYRAVSGTPVHPGDTIRIPERYL